jgi:carboxymethylenebutenolidase
MRREVLMLTTIACAAGCAGGRGGATPGDTAHVDAMAHEHAAETPAANAAQAEPRQPVTAQDVVYGTQDGRELRGYLAAPASAAAGVRLPGVVMIHEWWGLNDNIRMMARRLAGEGYRVLAVDMYGGQVASDPGQARTYMMQVMQNRPAGVQNLSQAADFLRGRQGAAKLGVIGWCFGGGWSLQSALQLGDRVDAAAVYYGQPVTDRAELAKLRAPLVGFFGLRDQGIPPDSVRRMEQELKSLGKTVDIRFYDANHAFANPSGQAYNPEAAADAWTRTLDFFNRTLKS